MRIRLPVLILVSLVLVALSLPAPAGARTPVAHRGVLRGDLGIASADPMAAARQALADHAGALGVEAASFTFESVRRSIVGVHVRGREHRGGVPVDGSSVAVHVVGGRVWQIEARPSALPGTASASSLPRDAAVALGLAALGITQPYVPPVAERALTPVGDRLVDAWMVTALSIAPAAAGTAVLDAASGAPIEIRDRRQFADHSAALFDPNPIVTARDSSLRQPGVDLIVDTDLDSPELTAQLRTMAIKDVDPVALRAGRLVGKFVDVQGPAPFGSRFHYPLTRANPKFEAAMAYAHIDRIQRYFQGIGFVGQAGVNNEPQNVIALPIVGFDNSFYQPGTDLMAFGAGGVDDGEDADVIIHEYGHAVHDAQVPGWGRHPEGGAMGEGFGDFLAAAYYAKTSGGFNDPCVADWDATSYSSDDPPCLRRTDTDKHYPEDKVNQVHADGEIWSAFLWDLREALGCTSWDAGCSTWTQAERAKAATDRVLKLLLTSHEFLTPNADFGDAVAALITAAQALGQSSRIPLIQAAANARGLPLS